MSDDGKCKNCGTAMAPMTVGNERTSSVVMSCPKGCGILAFANIDEARLTYDEWQEAQDRVAKLTTALRECRRVISHDSKQGDVFVGRPGHDWMERDLFLAEIDALLG